VNATERAKLAATTPVMVGAPALAKKVTVVALEATELNVASADFVAVKIQVPAAVALRFEPDTEQPEPVPLDTV
jgi:hypothetical protein